MQTLRQTNIEIEAKALAATILQEKEAGVVHFDGTAAVTDAFLTPFFRAVQREGFQAKLERGCMVLRRCIRCNKYSAGVYLKGSEEFELCPLCDRH